MYLGHTGVEIYLIPKSPKLWLGRRTIDKLRVFGGMWQILAGEVPST
jgi:hypothetical protein